MKLLLHIGTKKTGTTSLQLFIRANEGRLREQGFLVPNSFGRTEARDLTRTFRTPNNPDLSSPPWTSFRQVVDEAKRSGLHSVILSAESLVDLNRHQVATMAQCMRGIFSSTKVILYVRRQDRVAVSHYSTAIRGGGTPIKFFSERLGPTRRAMLYGTLMKDWGRAFGRDALLIRRFDSRLLVDGDVIADFCSAVGIESTGLSRLARENEALPGHSAVFLRFLNRLDKEHNNQLKPIRPRIVQALEKAGKTDIILPKPSRAEMAAFLASFELQNEMVRKRFFPNDEALFDNDLSMYPEERDASVQELTFDEAMRLAYSCLVALVGQMRNG